MIQHAETTARPKPELAGAFKEFDVSGATLIASRVLKPIGVQRQEGTITLRTREMMTKLGRDGLVRQPGTTYARRDIKADSTDFKCLGYGEEIPIPVENYKNYANVFDCDMVAAEEGFADQMRNLEYRVATAVFSTSTWTGSALYSDNSSAPWDTAGSDIIGQVRTAKQVVQDATGVKPNALICNEDNINRMMNTNTAIKAKFAGAVVMTWQMVYDYLAKILGLDMVIEGSAVYNSAKEGQDFSASDLWSDDYAMVAKVATTDNPQEPCIGRILYWKQMGNLVEVAQYYENQTKSNVTQVDMYTDEIIIDPYFGYLMKVDA